MSDFVEFVKETLEPCGEIRSRRMFGGHGIYRDDLMFAIVADDVLYLKADDKSEIAFRERGLARFQYAKNGKVINISYYAAPEEIFDDPEEAVVWASRAYEAAVRARKAGARRPR
jgi:DNA transformation protein